MMTRSRVRRLAAATLALTVGLAAQAGFTVTGFNSGQWGASDATLGVSGYVIEDFEDTTLASGLLIGWDTPAGSVTPAGTIPFTFNPPTQDPHGDAFDLGVWDGSNTLVNTRTNQTYTYTAASNWGDTLISFTSPATSVGFSLQQNENDVEVYINGSSIGFLQSLTGIAPNGGRYGYIRIDGLSGATISTLRLANYRSTYNDGWVIDHLAFTAVPEPSTYALFAGLGALLLAWRRRRAA
jgi:hypothetical protein